MSWMRDMQAEHKLWLARLYPNQPAAFPAAGMVEEAGELMHVLLKCQQASISGKHPEARYRDADWNAKFRDAVGDCAIYCCSLCNANGWDFEDLVEHAKLMLRRKVLTAFDAAAELVAHAVSACQEPSVRGCSVCFMAELLTICTLWGVDFETSVVRTWAEVKERT